MKKFKLINKLKWKNIPFRRRIILIFFLIGLSYIPFGFGVGSKTSSFFILKWVYSFWRMILLKIYFPPFCGILSIEGEECGFSVIFSSMFVIPLLFLIIGYLISRTIKKE